MVYITRRHKVTSKNYRRKHFMKPITKRISGNAQSILDISIPGLRKCLDPEYGFIRKIFWGCAIACCASICLYQLADRVTLYFNHPMFIDEFISRLQFVNFPSVMLCPARPPFSEKNVSNNKSYGDIRINVHELWKQYQIKEESVIVVISCVTVPFSPNCESHETVPMNLSVESIDTFWGTCTLLTPLQQVEFRGSFTFMDIELSGLKTTFDLEGRPAIFQYFVQAASLQLAHDAFYLADYAFKDSYMTLRLGMKEFNLKSTSKDPCIDPITATKCRNKCIDEKLTRSMNCSLPFVGKSSHTLPSCQTLSDVYSAYKQAQHVYTTLKANECVCQRSCKEIMYSVAVDVEYQLQNNSTVISLYYADNLLEVVNENLAYPFSALLSDIGGNLGFLLGVSVLTILEVLEALIQHGSGPLHKIWHNAS